MDRPGSYTLAALTVGAAITAQEQTAITDLEGMSSATFEAAFSGGTAGSTVVALIRTRSGSDGTWREIARFDFTTADSKWCTIAGSAASVAAFASLSTNAVLQGFLGTELEAVITSTGTYTNSSLAVRAIVR